MADILVIMSPTGRPNCEFDDGIPACLFLVSKFEWRALKRAVEKHKPTIERDCSDGRHNCILKCDLWDIVQSCCVVEKNPSKEIRRFIKKISDYELLYILREWVEDFEPQVFVVWNPEINQPQVFRESNQAFEAVRAGKGSIYSTQIAKPVNVETDDDSSVTD